MLQGLLQQEKTKTKEKQGGGQGKHEESAPYRARAKITGKARARPTVDCQSAAVDD